MNQLQAGLHISYVGQIERGLREPSLKALFKISKALGLELHTLFSPPESGDGHLAELELILEIIPGSKRDTFIEAVRRIAELSRYP